MKLEADGIQLKFGEKVVLNNIYLKLVQGEVVGILGLNGTGKSCLFQIIFGTLNAYSSSVRIDGHPVSKAWMKPGLMRYMPQNHYIPAGIRGEDVLNDFHLEQALFLDRFPKFEDRLRDKVRDLSGGMQRVLEAFIVLQAGANFVLLDEPFSSVSPVEIEKLKTLIREKKSGSGILLSDHYYRDMLDISDRIYLLRNHRLIEISHPDELQEYGYIPGSTK